MRIKWFFIWTNLNPFHPMMLCAKLGWNWSSASREKDFLTSFFNFVNVFSLLGNYLFIYLFIGKGLGPSIEQTWIPFTFGCFMPRLVEIGPGFWIRRLFNFVNVFSLFLNYLPLKSAWPFIWTNFTLHPRMLYAKFGWYWTNGSGEEDFKSS